MTVKIFQVNDYEYWAGETLEETTKACLEEWGMEEEALDEPHEITDEEMDTLTVTDDEGPERRTIPFRQALNELVAGGQEFPCLFAANDW